MGKIKFDKYSFIIDDKRVLIRSAAIHYFRLPGEKLWLDRLSKLKYAGYNTIDMYFNWGYHSKEPGKYDFAGIKNVDNLMQMATDLGLYIIARPGPYINAELSGGGFPGWLLGKEGVTLRNKKNNDFKYSPEYMKYVKEWYDQIIPRIINCPNIITVQIENEYSSNELEPDYIQELFNIVRSMGCNLPLMHNDMYAMGLYADIVDIYAVDNYSVTYFEKPWQSFPEVFSLLDNIEEKIREYSANSPLFIAELQAGWFDNWGGIGYEKISNALGREHLDIVTKTSLAQGVTAMTHYMGCGGTNWDHLGSTEVYSSYDFAAPITEAGMPTNRFYEAKQINNFLSSFDLTCTELAHNQPDIKFINPSQNLIYWTRENLNDSSRWLFLRNDSLGPGEAVINSDYTINISPQEMLILPSNLNINELTVDFSTLPFLCRLYDTNNQVIFPETYCSGEISINLPELSHVSLLEASENLSLERSGELLKIFFNKEPQYDKPLTVEIKGPDYNTRFIFLPESSLDYLHLIDNNLIIGPSYVTVDNRKTLIATDKAKELLSINCRGEITSTKVESPQVVEIIKLNNWDIYRIGKEIEDTSNDKFVWKEIHKYYDADSNGIHEGFFWYKTVYSGYLDKITLNVRHCFSLYLNGEEIFACDSFNSFSGIDTDKPVTITVPGDKQKENNVLIMLVQSMGHNKGFEDDAVNPRGLLNYKTTPKKELQWYIKPALTDEVISDNSLSTISNEIKNDYLICAVTKFNFHKPELHQIPLGLVFDDTPFNKANIYLNDVLIGHYWQNKGPQTKFYLPETFYHQDGQNNSLKLLIWYRSTDNNKGYTTPINNANIYLEPYGTYKLTELEE